MFTSSGTDCFQLRYSSTRPVLLFMEVKYRFQEQRFSPFLLHLLLSTVLARITDGLHSALDAQFAPAIRITFCCFWIDCIFDGIGFNLIWITAYYSWSLTLLFEICKFFWNWYILVIIKPTFPYQLFTFRFVLLALLKVSLNEFNLYVL